MRGQETTIPCHLKSGDDFFGNFQLKAHVPDKAIVPTFQEMSRIPEQPVKSLEWISFIQWAMPCPLNNIQKSGAPGPKCPKLKPTFPRK
jgi:hypothetical protein